MSMRTIALLLGPMFADPSPHPHPLREALHTLHGDKAGDPNKDASEVPESPCPRCGKLCSRATGERGVKVTPGALSICLGCGELLCFTETLSLAPADDTVLADAPPEQREAIARTRRQLRARAPS